MADDYTVRYVGDSMIFRRRGGVNVSPEDPLVTGLSESKATELVENAPFEMEEEYETQPETEDADPAVDGDAAVADGRVQPHEGGDTEEEDFSGETFNPETESEESTIDTEDDGNTGDNVEEVAEAESQAVDSDARQTKKDPELHLREDLEEMEYDELRTLAVEAETEEVNGRSSKEDIISTLATDSPEDTSTTEENPEDLQE